MAHYLQVERYLTKSLPSNTIIPFDREIAHSQSEQSDTSSGPLELELDFFLRNDGAIEIKRRGDYLIMWELTQLTERPLAEEFFQLKQWVNRPIYPGWEPMTGISTHIKTAATSGFAILSKTSSEPDIVALFNASEEDLNFLNFGEENTQHLKARLLLFGLSEEDGDYSHILDQLELDACCYDLDELASRINQLTLKQQDQYEMMEDLQVKYIELRDEFQYLSQPPKVVVFDAYSNTTYGWPGLKVCVMREGYFYYFWTEGTLTADVHMKPDQKQILLRTQDFIMQDEHGEDFHPFELHRYDYPLFGPAWINDTGDPVNVRVNAADGLYLETMNSRPDPVRGSTLGFTFTVVLAPASGGLGKS